MKIKVEVTEKLINNPGFWKKSEERFYYSGHCHRGSAIETDNSCGNCDEANCEICKKVIVESHYIFSCYTDTIYKDLLSQGIEESIAADLAYNDYGCKTHYLVMNYTIPETVKKAIETPNEEVWNWCRENYTLYPARFNDTPYKCDTWDMRDAYREFKQSHGISWDDGLDFFLNQIDFWVKTEGNK